MTTSRMSHYVHPKQDRHTVFPGISGEHCTQPKQSPGLFRPYRLTVRTEAFQALNRGSIPRRVTSVKIAAYFRYATIFDARDGRGIEKVVERLEAKRTKRSYNLNRICKIRFPVGSHDQNALAFMPVRFASPVIASGENRRPCEIVFWR